MVEDFCLFKLSKLFRGLVCSNMFCYVFWSHEPLYQRLGYIESRYVTKKTYCIRVELKNCRTETHEENNMRQKLREVQIKLMRGLLDLVILQYLKVEPMHGYQVITSIEFWGILRSQHHLSFAWCLRRKRLH